MGMGYEGWIRIKTGATRSDYLLGTGGGVPEARAILDSSSGYGGKINGLTDPGTNEPKIGIGAPHTYDWTNWAGSINFEIHEDALVYQVVPWIFNRQGAAVINLKSRAGNVQTFSQCFWNNITLSSSPNELISCSISFDAIDRDSYTIGGNYIGNKIGDSLFVPGELPANTYVPEPLWSDLKSPIPGWLTKWTADTGSGLALVTLQNWNLSYSQDIVKFFACDSNSTPQEPAFLAAGPMNIRFSGEYMFTDTADFSVPDDITETELTLGDTILYLNKLELLSVSDDVQNASSMTPLSFEYAVYEILSS